MILRRWILAFLLWSSASWAMSNSPIPSTPQVGDSSTVLSLEQFIELVAENHPVARSASLWDEKSQAQLRSARGAWDPVLSGAWKEKDYREIPYYNLFGTELTIPTPFGLEISGAVDRNRGNYLNPENNVTSDGVVALGMDLPLLSGLLFDERRGAVKKAKTLETINRADRDLQLNQLFFNAVTNYVDWVADYERLRLIDTVVRIAEQRKDFTLRSYERGAKPAIDTLEADIALQSRIIMRQEALIEYIKSFTKLQAFLWDSLGNPLYLSADAIPNEPSAVENWVMSIETLILDLDVHPQLQRLDALLEMNRIDRRVKLEKLKPKLDLSYRYLNTPIGFAQNDYWSSFTPSNYFVGVKWSTSLFLRSARNDLKLNTVKQQELNFKRSDTRLKLLMAITGLEQQFDLRAEQFVNAEKVTADYARLFRAEQSIFQRGGSSLFLLNSRESSYVQAGLKMWDAFSKYLSVRLEWQLQLGQLHQLANE